LKKAYLATAAGHFPAGGAIRQILHLVQVQGGFREYDHGLDENLKKYGQSQPPAYNVSKITVPMLMLAGIWDNLATIEQVKQVASLVPNLIEYREFGITHMDFVMMSRVKTTVYDFVLEKMNIYKTCNYCIF
jgi:hypothetical protein